MQWLGNLNVFLKENLKSARWIALDSIFSDHYGKLNLDYTNDGLHLNEQGYQLLEEIIKSELWLKKELPM